MIWLISECVYNRWIENSVFIVFVLCMDFNFLWQWNWWRLLPVRHVQMRETQTQNVPAVHKRSVFVCRCRNGAINWMENQIANFKSKCDQPKIYAQTHSNGKKSCNHSKWIWSRSYSKMNNEQVFIVVASNLKPNDLKT